MKYVANGTEYGKVATAETSFGVHVILPLELEKLTQKPQRVNVCERRSNIRQAKRVYAGLDKFGRSIYVPKLRKSERAGQPLNQCANKRKRKRT